MDGPAAAPPPPDGDAGLTLIEVVVALALFALVAAAGAGLVTSALDADRHTAGRLARLADIDRAAAVVGRDLLEIADAPLSGGTDGVAFARHRAGWDAGGGAVAVRYRLIDGRFERVVDDRPQVVLDRVAAVRWRYYAAPGGWQDRWPATTAQGPAWPVAVAVDLDLAGPPPHGRIRRVVELVARPRPPDLARP